MSAEPTLGVQIGGDDGPVLFGAPNNHPGEPAGTRPDWLGGLTTGAYHLLLARAEADHQPEPEP